MMREEAISFLRGVKQIMLKSNSWLESTDEPITEAFDMAIDALKPKNSGMTEGKMEIERKCENCKYYEKELWEKPCNKCAGDYECFEQNKIFDVLDALIKEAEKNPEWKAVNALRCAKKEISNLE